MTRGRPRKPTEQKRREGTFRADRDGGAVELEVCRPERPPWMSDDAGRHWDRLCDQLEAAGMLSAVDGDGLCLLCEAIAEYQAASDEVAADGLTAMSEKGGTYISAAACLRSAAWKKIETMLRRFGMTPSARASMRMRSDGEAPDEFDQGEKRAKEKGLR